MVKVTAVNQGRAVVINSLTIHGYRSCIDTNVELQSDLSVLVGRNGCGKTNLMNAFLLLKKMAIDQKSHYRNADSPMDVAEVKAAFTLGKSTASLAAKLSLYTEEDNTDTVVSSDETWTLNGSSDTKTVVHAPLNVIRDYRYITSHTHHLAGQIRLSFGDPLVDFPEKARGILGKVGAYLEATKYYSASQFTDPGKCPVSIEIDADLPRSRTRSKGHDRFLYDIYREFSTRKTSRYDTFLDAVGPNGLELVQKIDFKEMTTSSVGYSVRSGGKVRKFSRKKILVVPQFFIGSNQLSPSQLSEGTFKTLSLLFYIFTEQSSLLLVEEPEVCVHHGLLTKVVDIIRSESKHKQIVLSTHSEIVLDRVEPRHVYRVSNEKRRGTKVTQLVDSLGNEGLGALRMYLREEGNLGEYLRHGDL